MKKEKIVFIVVDGMADTPNKKNETPLSKANMKNVDYLTSKGVSGELIVVPNKYWDRLANSSISHVAAISLLGYNLEKFKPIRGPLEAIGNDIPYKQGWLAIRCNFSTIDQNMKIIDRRVGRNIEGLNELVKYINDNVSIGIPFKFSRTYGHRAVLMLKMGLSDNIVLNDPLEVGKFPIKISGKGHEGLFSAKILQNFIKETHKVLKHHPINSKRISDGIPPANYILMREGGNNLHNLPCFSKKFGVKPFCISEPGVDRGACILAGFESIKVPDVPFEESLDFIFKNICFVLEDHDFIFVHIKGPIDEASHDGNFDEKVKSLELLDKKMEIFRKFKGVVIFTTDHITSSILKKHMPGKVPVFVNGIDKDYVKKFDEEHVKKGRLNNYTPLKLLKYSLGK